jgi:hypothetical protein
VTTTILETNRFLAKGYCLKHRVRDSTRYIAYGRHMPGKGEVRELLANWQTDCGSERCRPNIQEKRSRGLFSGGGESSSHRKKLKIPD